MASSRAATPTLPGETSQMRTIEREASMQLAHTRTNKGLKVETTGMDLRESTKKIPI